ncbi:MAG TPA: ATP-binding cassette domain-containing protein, partial [Acidimicrobiales bacterium]|nr:ATP-binding cassette domain-containing protein [Acidimicrobiales bacterium]
MRHKTAAGRGIVGGTAVGAAGRWAAGTAGFALACLVAGAVLPHGLPFGVILLGLILGGLSSLTAMGLVILYRSARIINFAQAEIGGLAASVAVVMVAGWRLPYFVALPVGLFVALATGALVDLTVIRNLFQAPRLIVTVATIGLAQVIGAAELALPTAFAHLKPLTTFKTPFTFTFNVGPIVFNGNHVVAMLVIPAVLAGLALFFSRTSLGIAIRGAADSNDRAVLLGIPVRRLSTLTWVIAAGLSGIASMLSAPILGPQLGLLAGPDALLAPLTAAVVARMESLTVAFAASLAIGVFQQAVFWSYPRSTTVDVALFAVVLVALMLQRGRIRRADDRDLGSYIALQEVRPIPTVLRRLPEIRLGRGVVGAVVVLAALLVPFGLSDSKLTLLAYVAIYGILAVSLVVLTGWSGQISLGQFAFAGIGAGTTASLFVNAHADLFAALFAAAATGAVAAVVIGIPALRLPGLFLAVTTLAFAVPVSDYLLNSAYFPWFAPTNLTRPSVLQRFDLNSAGTFYYFCLAFLVLALAFGRNYRRARPGRVSIAVRDNLRGVASFGVDPVRTKLTAFAVAGAMAGVAGGLYAIGLRGIGFSGYNPENSVQVFTMVVIGGLGSLTGGLIGAFYVEGAQFFLKGAAQLLATGGGLLLVVQLFPAGLAGGVLYRCRDALLRIVAARRGLSVPSLSENASFGSSGEDVGPPIPTGKNSTSTRRPALLSLSGVDAAYGQVQVLFEVDLEVQEGDIVGLLGTNGAGKSTVLRVVSGLLRTRRGTVSFDGTDISKLHPTERVRRGLVTVPGGRGVFPSLTVAENLRLGSWLVRKDPAAVQAATETILGLFPALSQRLDVPAGLLSGGEQQMLTIAQSLYCQPKLIMIDELSLGLSPTVVSQLLDVIRRLAATGVTVLMVEQSLNLASSIAATAVFMERGQVRFSGETSALSKRPELVRAVFLGNGRRPLRVGATSAPRRLPSPPPSRNGHAPGQPPSFSVVEVSRRFGGVVALDGVSFDATPGEILGIIGANGAGKTTLFDICSGFLKPTRGRVQLRGYDVTTMPAHTRAELGLGRVFQDAALFASLTAAETLAVAFERHLEVRDPFLSILRTGSVARSEDDVSAKVEELIESFGLDRYRDAFVRELSTGTRRVLELACAVAHDPAVLLLDEPTSGIAQREGEALGQLLLDFRERTGATLVIIEHDVPLISSIADRLICLHLGEVISEGQPLAVTGDPRVIEAYLGADPDAIARSGRRPRATRSPAQKGARSLSAPRRK